VTGELRQSIRRDLDQQARDAFMSVGTPLRVRESGSADERQKSSERNGIGRGRRLQQQRRHQATSGWRPSGRRRAEGHCARPVMDAACRLATTACAGDRGSCDAWLRKMAHETGRCAVASVSFERRRETGSVWVKCKY